MSKERRYLPASAGAEIRATKDSRTVEGYAIVFGKESRDFGGWKEIIDSTALDGVLDNADVLALLDHNEQRGVLARYTAGSGSLALSVDDVGVKYRFEAPKFSVGEELLEGIERGDIRTSSFAFSVAEDGAKWEKQPDDSYIRRITKFRDIYDVSPVYREAYPDTSVAKRSLEEVRSDDKPDGKNEKPDKKAEESEKKSETDKKENPSTPSYDELKDHYAEYEGKLTDL